MSRASLDQTLEFIAVIDRARSADAVAGSLLETVERFGFSHVLAGTIPPPGVSEAEQVSNLILHRWPADWSARYFSKNYILADPTIHRVTSSIEPFAWSDIAPSFAEDRRAVEIMEEAREHRLAAGFTVPMMTLDGQSAGLSIAGERAD